MKTIELIPKPQTPLSYSLKSYFGFSKKKKVLRVLYCQFYVGTAAANAWQQELCENANSEFSTSLFKPLPLAPFCF